MVKKMRPLAPDPQPTKSKLKGYLHTRSYNRLVGSSTDPNEVTPELTRFIYRTIFLIFVLVFLGIGTYFALA